MLTGHWRQLDRDMVAFTTTPGFGLNGTGWLLLHPDGNVAFEAAPYYTPSMLAEIERLGGIRYLAASHCHGYGALWQLQDVFQPELLAIQKDDLRMTKAMRVTTPYDEALELRPGQRLLHVGGHYEGQAVLHDARRRILFCGDAFKVDQSPEGENLAISTHKAFHKSIPLTPA
jgi:glyoxylase-like metal-dependent hydrolase (beta-lactamase superfamily II)